QVVEEQTVGDGEGVVGPARDIIDGTAVAVAADAEGFIVRQDVVGNGQVGAGVEDGATPGRRTDHPAVGDRQAGDGGRPPGADVKEPAGVVAAEGQLIGARALDVQVLAERQLAAGQGDGLAAQAGVEDDLVTALGVGDYRPQRPVAAVG